MVLKNQRFLTYILLKNSCRCFRAKSAPMQTTYARFGVVLLLDQDMGSFFVHWYSVPVFGFESLILGSFEPAYVFLSSVGFSQCCLEVLDLVSWL